MNPFHQRLEQILTDFYNGITPDIGIEDRNIKPAIDAIDTLIRTEVIGDNEIFIGTGTPEYLKDSLYHVLPIGSPDAPVRNQLRAKQRQVLEDNNKESE